MMPQSQPQITSTAQLIPDGFNGYAKAWVAVVTAVLEAVVPFLAVDTKVAQWAHIALGVLGAVGVYLVPNAVKPTPPAPVLPEPKIPGP